MQPNTPLNLVLNYVVPTVYSDGSNVSITSEHDIPSLTFFQVRSQDNETMHADVVASVRFNSLEQLQELNNLISDTIKNHIEREK